MEPNLFLAPRPSSHSTHQTLPPWTLELQSKIEKTQPGPSSGRKVSSTDTRAGISSNSVSSASVASGIPIPAAAASDPASASAVSATVASSTSTNSTRSQDFDALSDLINGSVSDLWSHNDSQNLSVNLTSIMEDSDDKEVFFSPNDLFLDPLPKLSKLSPNTYSDITSTPIRRQSEGSVSADTPCRKLASKIEILDSPVRHKSSSTAYNELLCTQKVWTVSLDEELIRSWNKYKLYKASHPDPAIFKYTTRNKILSRMLYSRTNVFRSPKQVSARLQRLIKYKVDEANSTSFPATTVRAPALQPPIAVMPVSVPPMLQNVTSEYLNFHEFHMGFQFKDYMLGKHTFAVLGPTFLPQPTYEIFSQIASTIHHQKFLADLTQISPVLSSRQIPIHNVLCSINFNTQPDASSPLSPEASSHLINLSNGLFLSFLKLRVPCSHSKKPFLAWRSIITVYKGLNEILLSTEDAVNGYKDNNQDYILQIPFLNSFWSGYLSFLMNGTNSFKDLNDLTILQAICEGENGLDGIKGYFIYNFTASNTISSSLHVSMFKLQNMHTEARVDDFDEVETILAPSSPIASSPHKPEMQLSQMRINVDLDNLYDMPGPATAPVFDARAIQGVNCNYNSRPGPGPQNLFHASKSSTNVMSQANGDGAFTKRQVLPRHFSCDDVISRETSLANELNSKREPSIDAAYNPLTCHIPTHGFFKEEGKHFDTFIDDMGPGVHPESIELSLGLNMLNSKRWNLNTESIAFEAQAVQSAPAGREHFFPDFGTFDQASNDASVVVKQAQNRKMSFQSARRDSHISAAQHPQPSQVGLNEVSGRQGLQKFGEHQEHKELQNQASFHKFQMTLPVMYQPKK